MGFDTSWNSVSLFYDLISQGHDCLPGFELIDGNIKGRGVLQNDNVEHEK